MVLINKEKINLVIRTHIEGPFQIVKTDPLGATIGNSLFNIIPNCNLKLDIKFLCPNPDDEIEWPMTLLNEKYGKLVVTFENQETKEFLLHAVLRRPRIILSTTGNEFVKGPNVIDFGKVNCESNRRSSLFLSNETEVETKWSIHYVKQTSKKIMGHGTITKEEQEDLDKTDDPNVFEFNIREGIIYGPSQPLINIPLRPVLPVVPLDPTPEQIKAILQPDWSKNSISNSSRHSPVKIEVMFKVRRSTNYSRN